ncbi:MAG TPA: hypothetical protein PLJ74_05350 [Myxococcota bacterium]|nr:hypothetical protein [Myxococcota bacterium]
MTKKTYLIRDFPADLHRSAQILACNEQTTLKALLLEGLAMRILDSAAKKLKVKPETSK